MSYPNAVGEHPTQPFAGLSSVMKSRRKELHSKQH